MNIYHDNRETDFAVIVKWTTIIQNTITVILSHTLEQCYLFVVNG